MRKAPVPGLKPGASTHDANRIAGIRGPVCLCASVVKEISRIVMAVTTWRHGCGNPVVSLKFTIVVRSKLLIQKALRAWQVVRRGGEFHRQAAV